MGSLEQLTSVNRDPEDESVPDMAEIYRRHAARYDELVRAEDHENNLGRLLPELVDWTDLAVLEAGVGTGRVTRLYIDQVGTTTCCDRSPHMLEFARGALKRHRSKLTFIRADNLDLPQLSTPVDLFIEGWSFGHAVSGCVDAAEVRAVTDRLIASAGRNLKPGGTMIFIETLGTNVDRPVPPHDNLQYFYNDIEQRVGFEKHLISTDYRFSANGEAARVMGFFFGDEMARGVVERGTTIIPEWTGVWIGRI